MERTQIYLSEAESAALDREAAASRRSKSDLIREAIDRAYLVTNQQELVRALAESAGAWRGRQETGAETVERLRSGRLARLHGVKPASRR